jgi:hypothetical protein
MCATVAVGLTCVIVGVTGELVAIDAIKIVRVENEVVIDRLEQDLHPGVGIGVEDALMAVDVNDSRTADGKMMDEMELAVSGGDLCGLSDESGMIGAEPVSSPSPDGYRPGLDGNWVRSGPPVGGNELARIALLGMMLDSGPWTDTMVEGDCHASLDETVGVAGITHPQKMHMTYHSHPDWTIGL